MLIVHLNIVFVGATYLLLWLLLDSGSKRSVINGFCVDLCDCIDQITIETIEYEVNVNYMSSNERILLEMIDRDSSNLVVIKQSIELNGYY